MKAQTQKLSEHVVQDAHVRQAVSKGCRVGCFCFPGVLPCSFIVFIVFDMFIYRAKDSIGRLQVHHAACKQAKNGGAPVQMHKLASCSRAHEGTLHPLWGGSPSDEATTEAGPLGPPNAPPPEEHPTISVTSLTPERRQSRSETGSARAGSTPDHKWVLDPNGFDVCVPTGAPMSPRAYDDQSALEREAASSADMTSTSGIFRHRLASGDGQPSHQPLQPSMSSLDAPGHATDPHMQAEDSLNVQGLPAAGPHPDGISDGTSSHGQREAEFTSDGVAAASTRVSFPPQDGQIPDDGSPDDGEGPGGRVAGSVMTEVAATPVIIRGPLMSDEVAPGPAAMRTRTGRANARPRSSTTERFRRAMADSARAQERATQANPKSAGLPADTPVGTVLATPVPEPIRQNEAGSVSAATTAQTRPRPRQDGSGRIQSHAQADMANMHADYVPGNSASVISDGGSADQAAAASEPNAAASDTAPGNVQFMVKLRRHIAVMKIP